MEQRDYLMDQIEQLGRALGKILADLLDLKSQGRVQQGIEAAQVSLQERLDLEDLDAFMYLSTEAFLERLKKNPHLNPMGLQRMADILYEMGSQEDENQKAYLQKSLAIYHYLMHLTRTYAMDWTEKIETIKAKLQS